LKIKLGFMWLQPNFSMGNFDMKSDIPCENIF